eukprot:Em0018g781a
MTRYYKSFVGRDFKLLAQLAVHLLSLYMDDGVWLKLSKLSTAALELGAIKMTIPEHDTILLSQAIASCTLLIPPSLKSSTRVTISAAIYGSAGNWSILGRFRTFESSYCTVQVLEPEKAIPQGCILYEFDCPLLTMVDFFHVIPSSSVCAAVSVVHKCTTTCSFVEKTASVVVEGCDTSINRLVFVHDSVYSIA